MEEAQKCPATGYQELTVTVPVEVNPHVKTGKTHTTCCGKATVKPGITGLIGDKKGTCFFTITQKLCVEVPVEFSAEAKVDEPYVECLDASATDICKDCHKEG